MKRKDIAPARKAAFTVLESVAGGGYASDLLRDATSQLSTRDAGLAGQLVLGSLRVQNQLDYLIERYSGRAPENLDLTVRMALRIGIFQLRYLERVPPHAAVDDAVEFVKKSKRSAAGLTNAVLRKVNRDPVQWPDDAITYACPDWLLSRWKEHFGTERALAIATAALQEPEPFVRIRPGGALPDGLDLEPTAVQGCYRLRSPLVEGIRLHDISSQTIVPLLGLKPDHSFLDLCCAPANKTLQALETNPRFVVACDISERRLASVNDVPRRVVLDASEQLPFGRKFDRILIDAPCSGTGTLARNPEIKWRLDENELVKQHSRQVNILKRASQVLAPEGKIVYATCSLEKEENEEVIKEATATTRLQVESELRRLPGRDLGDGFYAALLVETGPVS